MGYPVTCHFRGCSGTFQRSRPARGRLATARLEVPDRLDWCLDHDLVTCDGGRVLVDIHASPLSGLRRLIDAARAFYSEVLGGQVVLEENPCMIRLSNSWVIMNPGGGPTPDKPNISVVNYEPGNTVSSFMNLRVADIQACYEQWSSKGAEFVTPPIDRGAEIRCYMRDPDGYMIEVGQSTGPSHHAAASRAKRQRTNSSLFRPRVKSNASCGSCNCGIRRRTCARGDAPHGG
jgi:predicted enzyme related to lactoylglutathione lyase